MHHRLYKQVLNKKLNIGKKIKIIQFFEEYFISNTKNIKTLKNRKLLYDSDRV